jgi:membrane-associated phospholipid phosphatase
MRSVGPPGHAPIRLLQPRRLSWWRRSPWHSVRWPFIAYAAIIVTLSHFRRRLRLSRPLMVPVVSTTPVAVAVALPRSKWRYAATWATNMWLFRVAWEIPYDRPDKLRSRLRVRESIELDSLIGGGEPPSLRLQRALRDPSRVKLLDTAMTAAFYGLWVVPHAVLAWILVRHEERFAAAAGRLATVYHLTTVSYWIRPSAPPWWASEHEGEMEGAVRRVTREVTRAVRGRFSSRRRFQADVDRDPEEFLAEGNPWASMPSDHFAAAAMTAMCLAEMERRVAAAGWLYVAAVGFAVVYLGEHYVIDLIAALALAAAVRWAEPAVRPLVRIGVGVLKVLEPPTTASPRTPRRALTLALRS